MKKQQLNEIVAYRTSDGLTKLNVLVENETVWLTQAQMVDLFAATKQNVNLHINNIFKEKELLPMATVKDSLTVQKEGGRTVKRTIKYYNLDVIISVGYRVKSLRGTQFRIWANSVLKDYLLKGYAVNQRVEHLERKVCEHDQQIATLVQQAMPPREGIFFDGQFFDAYTFVVDLIKKAKTSIVLIDNYVDESVLTLLSKRKPNVVATIYTKTVSKTLQLDLQKHNAQYPAIELKTLADSHDRFLIIDRKELYHIGASLKDVGKKWFAFSKMDSLINELLNKLDPK